MENLSDNFFAIDRKRRARGLSVGQLCAAAKVSVRSYERWLARQVVPLAPTLARLARCLGTAATPDLPALAREHRLIVIALALLTGDKNPAAALAHDFSVQRPQNKDWLAAARLRRFAMTIAVVELGCERVALGAALGCSRQNIKQAIDWTEAQRDADPDVDGVLARVAQLVTGREA